MTTDQILETAGIPLLLFVILILLWNAVMVYEKISPPSEERIKPPVKDEENYAKCAGKLMFFFAVATLVMMLLLFWNTYVAVAEIIICTVILGILWHNMNAKYGD